uniref:cGMP-dependent protein kinase n=1 Tax=Parastrongyloides trichosuri TaxID=131310 RepID=A0A0N4ZJ64_PARTI
MPFMKSSKTITISGKTLNIEDVQRLIPELENDILRKDRIIHEYKSVHDTYRQKIRELEEQLLFFQAECDKLRSVLEQTTVSATTPYKCLSQKSSAEMLVDDLQNKTALSNVKYNNITSNRSKKVAVSAEPALFGKGEEGSVLQHHPKSTTGGHYILREGEKGNTFFVINSGSVRITQQMEDEIEPREIRIMGPGDFFGEKALLGEQIRTANVIAMNPGVEVLTLDRVSFLNLIGDLEALKRDYGDNERRRTHKEKRHPSNELLNRERCAMMNELKDLQLKHLKRIATLGVGGFGRVELVCINNDKSRTFALKAMKKKHIVDTKQQEHIFSERNILFDLNSDWIVNLYKTFRDSKYVYMLLEACLGGELWTTLRDHGHFDEFTARFYIACVLEALDYIHSKNIIYRDLKPENCLITSSGYIKLVDFGFAKRLASGRKTWTFCGTPEYVSPEIILNKGHDRSADLWSVGIFTCELLLGRPPFQAADPMKTYTLILKGVDALDIPNKRMGKAATTFVKKLCKDNPAERLGIGIAGINDIRKNRWFMGFDWEGLRSRTAKPPLIPRIENASDHRNFDDYEVDNDIPPDEFSGWDEGF